MKQSSCRSAIRLIIRIALLTVGLSASVTAQSPITIVSPHAGEEVGARAVYFVRWTAPPIAGNARFYVYYISTYGPEHVVCTAPPSARQCEWLYPGDSSASGGTSGVTLFVEARDGSGVPLARTQSAPFDIVNENLGAEWEYWDIGDVGRSGTARGGSEWNPTLVRGAGADIWGTADAFHYVYRELGAGGGDVDATATITGVEGTHAWTKVGVMLRDNLTPGSPHQFVLASRSKGIAYQRRLTANGPSLHTTLSASSALPLRVEVMRRAGYTAINVQQGDGPWQQVTLSQPEGWFLFGLAVTSHDRSVLATGTFSDVSADVLDSTVTILSPEGGEQVSAGAPYTIRWTHAQPVNIATVSYSIDNGQTWTVIPGCASIASMSCTWNNPGPESEAARVRVVIEDPNDRGAWNVTYPFAIRSGPITSLPEGWVSGDVGGVAANGSATYAAGTGQFTLEGSGADIWGTADEFQFVSRTIADESGEVHEITARITSIENVNRWTKVGLMVRAHRGAEAAHAFLFVTPTTEKGIAFQRRRSDNAATVHTTGPAITAPVWLKLVTKGGVVRAYYRKAATDEWTFVDEDQIAVTLRYEAGLAVSSHVDGTLARATFDNVSVHSQLPLASADIGAVGVPGATATNDLTRTLWGSGADIWGTADAFRYHYNESGHVPRISARVKSVENTHAWAKAGVMIRVDLTPGSPHVMLIASPGKGIAMQYRATRNGTTANVAIEPGTAPAWLRLTRTGPAVVGEVSADGVTWSEIGRVHIVALEGGATVGLAVTSHDNATLAKAEFDDVLFER